MSVRGLRQAAYNLSISDSPLEPVWSSGRLKSSSDFVDVPVDLAADRLYYYDAEWWPVGGQRTEAVRATLDTGLFSERDSEGAQWLTSAEDGGSRSVDLGVAFACYRGS